jgi:hypothetical protein
MGMRTYRETFDEDNGGWWGWISNQHGPLRLENWDGALLTRSPWWIDYNHAPPGAGYLHMLYCMNTKGPFSEAIMDAGGPNRFAAGGYPTNFVNARLTLRLRGELDARGANPLLLVQASGGGLVSGWLLTGQPLQVQPEWYEQTVTLAPDPRQWTCLGSRHNRADYYGYIDLATVLADVNVNIMLVLFPLTIAPMGPLDGDPHMLRPGKDYPVWTSRLPEGYILLDEVSIAFGEA